MDRREDIDGYTVAYSREEIQFPVYVILLVGIALIACAFAKSNPFIFVLGTAAAGFAYYNFPLLESGRHRLGAGQYGILIEGLGVIAWRAIKDIELISIPARGVAYQELSITLNQPLHRALIADWRRRPVHRALMRLPWSMNHDSIRIALDIFDRTPSEVHHSLSRMWRHFRA